MTIHDRAAWAAELFKQHKSIRAAARAAGVDRKTIKHHLHRAAALGLLGTKPILPGFEIKQTSAQYDKAGEVEKQWVKQRKETGQPFAMPAGQALKGVSQLTDSDGRTLLTWHKTSKDTSVPDVIAACAEAFKQYKGRAKPALRPKQCDDDLCSVYPIADLHLGMLSYGRETGEPYDLKIAAERLRDTMRGLVSQSPNSRTAIVLQLGDWTHNDDQRNATPASGHGLDVDSRYSKILMTGVQLMQDCIDLALQKHETVLVRNIPGNHDPHASLALTIALACFYSKEPRVTIDTDPSEWFFYRFGATLIGAHHGHRAKPDALAMTMATRKRAEWGATAFHWFLRGHFHQDHVKEIGDCRVECFRTLASKDAYSHNNGFTSGQTLVAVTLHKTRGQIGRHFVNLAPVS